MNAKVLLVLLLGALRTWEPAAGAPLPFPLVRELELRLDKQYGAAAVSALRKMLKDFGHAPADLPAADEAFIKETLTAHFGPAVYAEYQRIGREQQTPEDPQTQLVRNVVKLIKQQFHRLAEVCDTDVKPQWSHFLAVAALSKQMKTGEDVPCKDEQSCKKLEHLVNRCNYARRGAMTASNIFNSITHVLNGVMSLMCGCLFVGPVHLCVLKNFPYTCKLPYPVYASLYMGTSQVWEVVKATSNMCRIYGDPGLGSIVK